MWWWWWCGRVSALDRDDSVERDDFNLRLIPGSLTVRETHPLPKHIHIHTPNLKPDAVLFSVQSLKSVD